MNYNNHFRERKTEIYITGKLYCRNVRLKYINICVYLKYMLLCIIIFSYNRGQVFLGKLFTTFKIYFQITNCTNLKVKKKNEKNELKKKVS